MVRKRTSLPETTASAVVASPVPLAVVEETKEASCSFTTLRPRACSTSFTRYCTCMTRITKLELWINNSSSRYAYRKRRVSQSLRSEIGWQSQHNFTIILFIMAMNQPADSNLWFPGDNEGSLCLIAQFSARRFLFPFAKLPIRRASWRWRRWVDRSSPSPARNPLAASSRSVPTMLPEKLIKTYWTE